MPEFVYTAVDRSGTRREGRVSADNSAIAVGRLRAQGLEVERIRAAAPEQTVELRGAGPSIGSRLAREVVLPVASGVPLKDLALFYRQLATLVSAGMALYQALVALEGQTRNARLRSILQESQAHVVGGGRLSDVFERHRYVFTELQIALLRAAEHGGMLEDALKRLAEYLEQELALRRMISRLTLYPKLVLLSALFILGRSFFTDGMPAFSKLIVGSMGKTDYTGWDYFVDTALVLVVLGAVLLAVMAVARTVLFRSPAAREMWERLKLGVPGVGGVAKSFAATRFGRAFGAMYGAGVTMGAAVRVAGQASGSRLIASAVERAMDRVERGEPLSSALSSAGVLPPLVLDMLRTGEQTGNLDTMMTKAADHLEGEAETRAHQYSHLFATGVYLLVAILVGFAVVSFWTSYAGGYG